MRLVYIDPHPIPDPCPEAMQILQTVDALAQLGVEVILAVPPSRSGCTCEQILSRPLHPGVRFHKLDDYRDRWWYPSRSGRLFYTTARRFVTCLKDVDGLLIRNLKLAESLLDVSGRPPIIFETHEVFARTFAEDHPQPGWKELRKLAALRRREQRVYSSVDGIAALTEWLIEDLRSEYGVTTPAAVVPDGVDLLVASVAPQKPAWSTPPELLYLGSLHPWKGVERLLAALPMIDSAQLVIGGGPQQRIAELEELALELKVGERVRFLGYVPPALRFQAIANADICLLPLTNTSIGSRYTSPLKLFEYMGMGKPVVAADVPALRSVIASGKNGLLVSVEDPVSMAAGVNALLRAPALARSLGSAAQQSARDYAWTSRAEKLHKLFASFGADSSSMLKSKI